MPESDPDPEAAPLLIVTDDSAAEPESWPRGARRVAATEYLTGAASTARAATRVLNQSTATRYLEAGYYVSLLAAARGHKVQPTAAQLLDAALPQERKAAFDAGPRGQAFTSTRHGIQGQQPGGGIEI